MTAACWHCVAFTRRGLRVRKVFMKALSPDGVFSAAEEYFNTRSIRKA